MNCKYPSCHIDATHTWALVPLCQEHYEAIKTETETYYTSSMKGHELERRPQYMQISRLIPWSKDRQKQYKGGKI